MNRVKAWLIAGRFFSGPWMLVNTLFGACLAGFDVGKWLLSFAIILSILTAAHYLNAWRDFVRGLDKVDEGSAAKPYTAGSQVLPRGWLQLRTIKISAAGFLVLSTLLLPFVPRRIDVYALYGLSVSMALTYTDLFKPRGLGEVALFLGHGFGATSFAYSLIKPVDLTGLAGGILLGLWAGILYTIDQWQDVTTDFAEKLKNLAYMVFKANMRISQVWYFLVTASLVMQVGMILMGWFPSETLATVFILPLAYVTGVLLDYQFDRGVILALITMWLYGASASLGLLFLRTI
ncbi:MAG: hypothetical protein ACE5Z5_07080 [Candidatus Bathyarchaeia archaeon]